MGIAPLIDEYAAYDLWANTRLVERLQRERDDLLDTPVRSSFPSLRATLLHVRDAHHVWLCRLTSARHNWPAEEDRSLGTLLKHASLLRAHVRGLDDAALLQRHTYHDLKGRPHEQEAWRMLMHALNHASQHRGQAVTIMRQLGLEEIPALDLVVFQRSLPEA
jgi:uncharacterized damage-inducible protein DinB